MSYSGTRLCYDADSHIMELPDFFKEFADEADRAALPELNTAAGSRIGPMIAQYAKTRKHSADEVAAQVALGDKLVTGAKGYQALGAFNRDERRQALDQLGFRKQLVFSTFAAGTVFREDKGLGRPAIRRRPRPQPVDGPFLRRRQPPNGHRRIAARVNSSCAGGTGQHHRSSD